MTDTVAARELALFAINDGDLYRQQGQPIIANLKRKIAKGVYQPTLALKLWGYLAESAAKKYVKEFGSTGDKWYQMFPPGTRSSAAMQIANHYAEALKE